jgi:hypothetical protein
MRLRHWVFPLLLAALVARAFVPPGFMTVLGEGQSARVAMCSYDPQRREIIELPGGLGSSTHENPRCDHCLGPLVGAPIAFLDVAPAAPPIPLRAVPFTSQLAFAAPEPRAQIPRAPPQA